MTAPEKPNEPNVSCDHSGAWASMSLNGTRSAAETALVALTAAHGNTSQLIVQLPWVCFKARRNLVEQLDSITKSIIAVTHNPEAKCPDSKP